MSSQPECNIYTKVLYLITCLFYKLFLQAANMPGSEYCIKTHLRCKILIYEAKYLFMEVFKN